MARARNIKPGLFSNDLLAEIDIAGRYLFSGLWTQADREGRLEDRPKKIKVAVLPYDDVDVDLLLTELAKRKFIIRYSVGEEKYIQVVNWKKHQNPHVKEAPSIIPEPPKYMPEPPKHGTSMVQASDKNETSRADSLSLDSFNLIPDSLIPDSSSTAAETALKPFELIMNTYLHLRQISPVHINAIDRDIVDKLSESEIPPDFVVSIMVETSKTKEINSMRYYDKVIRDRWDKHLTALEGGNVIELNSRSPGQAQDDGKAEPKSIYHNGDFFYKPPVSQMPG